MKLGSSVVLVVCVATAFASHPDASTRAPQASPRPAPVASHPPADDYRALVDKYCVTCHNQRTKTADLTLDTADLTNIPAAADVWEKVTRKIRAGMMPPVGMPRPEQG